MSIAYGHPQPKALCWACPIFRGPLPCCVIPFGCPPPPQGSLQVLSRAVQVAMAAESMLRIRPQVILPLCPVQCSGGFSFLLFAVWW